MALVGGFWFCCLVAVAVVVRRLIALVFPVQSGPPAMVALDKLFASHAALTLAHILPSLVFVCLLPFVFMRRFSSVSWPERALFPLGAVVGLTAYAMSAHAIGGWVERSAVLFYNSLFLYSLVRAFQYGALGDARLKRRWLLRAVAIVLGISTTRPVMGVFFATSSVTHLAPQQFFGVAFWIGFSINWAIVEAWLRTRREVNA